MIERTPDLTDGRARPAGAVDTDFRLERSLTPVVTVVVVLWCLLAFTWPISGDAGIFNWIADTVIRGGAPYADAWDTKGPGAWLPSLLMQRLTGRNAWGLRLFDMAMLGLALVSLRHYATSLELPGRGRLAMLFYAVWYTNLDFWQSAQPDGWAASWLITACALSRSRRVVALALAGALIALASLSKPFYAGFLVVAFLGVWSRQPSTTKDLLRRVACIVAGYGAAVAVILWALSRWHGLEAFIDAQRWTRDVYAGLSDAWLSRLGSLNGYLFAMPYGILVPLAAFGALRAPITNDRGRWPVIVGFVGATAGVVLQGRFWQYHGLPMLPFLALLADFGVTALRQSEAGARMAQLRSIVITVALASALVQPWQALFRYAKSRRSDEATAAYEKREFRYYGRHPGSVYSLVDSLLRRSGPDAEIMIWAMQWSPHYLQGLRVPTRFAVIRPLIDGPGTTYRERYRSEFLREVTLRPPHWWLLPSDSLVGSEQELRDRDVAQFPELRALLDQRYREAFRSSEWRVLELRDAPSMRR